MLKVLTLNLWNSSGPWAERAKLIREWLDRLEPDLIGLQEVVRQPGLDQLAELFEGSGYHTDYVAASPFWKDGGEDRVGEVGNAVASRFPILERAELRLPESGGGEKRAALESTSGAVVSVEDHVQREDLDDGHHDARHHVDDDAVVALDHASSPSSSRRLPRSRRKHAMPAANTTTASPSVSKLR